MIDDRIEKKKMVCSGEGPITIVVIILKLFDFTVTFNEFIIRKR